MKRSVMPKTHRQKIGKNKTLTYSYCKDFKNCAEWQNPRNYPENQADWHYHKDDKSATYPFGLMDIFSI